MTKKIAVGGEEMKRAAYGALQLLKDNLPPECKLSVSNEDNFVICALRRHGAHLSIHTISQDNLDPLKLLCWIGGAVIDGVEDVSFHQQEVILNAILNSLEETLMLETNKKIRLESDDRILLQRFVMQEIKGNSEHGIGYNGLFTAFHCFRSAYKQISK
jgi:hypothetical protein